RARTRAMASHEGFDDAINIHRVVDCLPDLDVVQNCTLEIEGEIHRPDRCRRRDLDRLAFFQTIAFKIRDAGDDICLALFDHDYAGADLRDRFVDDLGIAG